MSQEEGNRADERTGAQVPEELLRELGCSVSRKGNLGDSTLSTRAQKQVVHRGCRQGLVSFSQVASDRTRGQPQAVLGRFRLDIRKNHREVAQGDGKVSVPGVV